MNVQWLECAATLQEQNLLSLSASFYVVTHGEDAIQQLPAPPFIIDALGGEADRTQLLFQFIRRAVLSRKLLDCYLKDINCKSEACLINPNEQHMVTELALQTSYSAVCTDIAMRFFANCLYRNAQMEPPLRFQYGDQQFRFSTEQLDMSVQFYVEVCFTRNPNGNQQVSSHAVRLLEHGQHLKCTNECIQVAFPVLVGEQKLPENAHNEAVKLDK